MQQFKDILNGFDGLTQGFKKNQATLGALMPRFQGTPLAWFSTGEVSPYCCRRLPLSRAATSFVVGGLGIGMLLSLNSTFPGVATSFFPVGKVSPYCFSRLQR